MSACLIVLETSSSHWTTQIMCVVFCANDPIQQQFIDCDLNTMVTIVFFYICIKVLKGQTFSEHLFCDWPSKFHVLHINVRCMTQSNKTTTLKGRYHTQAWRKYLDTIYLATCRPSLKKQIHRLLLGQINKTLRCISMLFWTVLLLRWLYCELRVDV